MEQKHLPPQFQIFTEVYGDLPFVEPNVKEGHEEEDLGREINKEPKSVMDKWVGLIVKGLFTIGIYPYLNWIVIPRGNWGFKFNHGTGLWRFLKSGQHNLASKYCVTFHQNSSREEYIQHGYITIVRVPQGSLGFAKSNGQPLILEPGLHIRTERTFEFKKNYQLDQLDSIEEPPIKLFIVKSGTVRICFINGKVKIYSAGRYAINSAAFSLGPIISLQQKAFKLTGHQVLLDGGINMIVEGLVIYQVTNTEKLVLQSGLALNNYNRDGTPTDDDMLKQIERNIEVVCKAELSRVFAVLHLEDISSGQNDGDFTDLIENEKSVLGKKGPRKDGETLQRSKICSQILEDVGPILERWGLTLHNFQLESTTIADKKYANDYESASLEMAKAKSNFRTQQVQKHIQQSQSETQANSIKIQAEGDAQARRIKAQAESEAKMTVAKTEQNVQLLAMRAKAESKVLEAKAAAEAQTMEAKAAAEAIVLKAEAEASAKLLEGKARGEAAIHMKNPFAQQIALLEQDISMVKGIKIDNLLLTNNPSSSWTRAVQSMGAMLSGRAVTGAEHIKT